MKIAICTGLDQRADQIIQFTPLKKDHNLTFFTYFSDKYPKFDLSDQHEDQINIEYYPYSEKHANYMNGLEDKLSEFDLVISYSSNNLHSYQALKAKERYNIPLIIAEKDTVPFYYESYDNIITMKRAIYKNADLIITSSKASKTNLMIEGVKEKRIRIVKPWIKGEQISTAEKAARAKRFKEYIKLNEKDFLVLCHGDMLSDSSHFNILTALKYIDQTAPNRISAHIKLLYLFPPTVSEHLKKRVFDTGIGDRAMFLSEFPKECYLDIILASDLFIVGNGETPYIKDSIPCDLYPYQLLNFMSHKKPIITFDNGLSAEIVGSQGIRVRPGDYAELGEMITTLFEDREMYDHYAEYSKSQTEKSHSMYQFEETMENILHQLPHEIKPHGELHHEMEIVSQTIENHEYETAIEALDELLAQFKLSPNQKAFCFSSYGDCYYHLGDMDSSVDNYEKSLRFNPNQDEAYRGLGGVSMQLGQYDHALSFFQNAMKYNPQDDRTLLGLGTASFHLQNYQDAHIWFQKAMNYNPSNPRIVKMIIQLSNILEDHNLLESTLYEYLQNVPEDIKMWEQLGRFYQKQGSIKDCLNVVEKIKGLEPENKLIEELSQFCAAQEQDSSLKDAS